MYNKSNGCILIFEHTDYNSYVYSDDSDIIHVCCTSRPMMMQQIADEIADSLNIRRTKKQKAR